jgi:hypothetical protein
MFHFRFNRQLKEYNVGSPGKSVRSETRYHPRMEILEDRFLLTTVTTLGDGDAGSLRTAILITPANGTVDFASGLSGTIQLTRGTLFVINNLNIAGPGADRITVRGGGNVQVINIARSIGVRIAGLTITNGGPGSNGGGIRNDGSLAIEQSNISGNAGQGIVSNGILAIDRSNISDNLDIGINVNNGSLTLTNSTVANNRGTGINNVMSSATIANSTISNNSGSGNAGTGGINNTRAGLTLTNSTVAGNQGINFGTTVAGGILSAIGSSLNLRNTIVAGNSVTGFGSSAPDLFGIANSANNNLIGDGTGSSGVVNGVNGNIVGTGSNPVDPQLGPLRNNGGSVLTRALLPGSPAVNSGNNAFSPGPSDERGYPRIVGGIIDMGAYELQRLDPAHALFALGGVPGKVQVRKVSDGSLLFEFSPYGPSYQGGVAVAVADIDGDGFPDVITGATSGNPHVKVFSGAVLFNGFNPANPDAALLTQFFAYGLNFNVGANVAAGDVNNDGFPDIVTGASAGNPHVKVYNGRAIATGALTSSTADANLLTQFFAYGLQFNIGANVAVGDVNHDGFAEVVTGATTGNPHVKVYDGQAIANGTFDPFNPDASLLAQFFPYALQFNLGAFVAVGDVNGDGFGDIITGASTGNPHVKVYNGLAIANGTFDNANPDTNLLDQFFAFNTDFGSGASVASADFNGDGRADILAGTTAVATRYRVMDGLLSSGIMPPAINGIDGILSSIQGGVLVGA